MVLSLLEFLKLRSAICYLQGGEELLHVLGGHVRLQPPQPVLSRFIGQEDEEGDAALGERDLQDSHLQLGAVAQGEKEATGHHRNLRPGQKKKKIFTVSTRKSSFS